MKITDVKITRVYIPWPEPGLHWGWRATRTKGRTFGILEVSTDEGITGVCTESPSVQLDLLRRVLVGADPFDVGRIMKELRDLWTLGLRRSGGVESALWDIIGKSCRRPLYQMLGAYQDKVKAYVSTAEHKTPKEQAKMARRYLEEGFKAIKLRCHRPDPQMDLEVVKAVRGEVGDEMEIMVDVNQGRSHLPPYWTHRDALKMARELEKLDVVWLEEPLPQEDLDGLAALSATVDIYIAGAESEWGLTRFKEILEKKAFDVINPDVRGSGGITEVRKIAALAEAHHMWCVPHNFGGDFSLATTLQVTGSIPNCPYVEFPYEPPVMTCETRDILLTEPIVAQDGYVAIPRGPGLGVELNTEVMQKYAL